MSNPAQLKQSMRYQKWFEEVQAYKARPEGVSSAAWCEANGIKPATFYCRLRKIQQLYVDSLEQTSIVPVKSVEPPAVVEPTFVELAPAPSSKTVRISSGVASILCGSTRIVGIASYVKMQFQLDSFDKDILFLFCGRKATKIKGLVWEGDGFLLLYKRLEVESFAWPRTAKVFSTH